MTYISRLQGPFELFNRPMIVNPPEYEYDIVLGPSETLDRSALESALRAMRRIKNFMLWGPGGPGPSYQLRFELKILRRLDDAGIREAITASIT